MAVMPDIPKPRSTGRTRTVSLSGKLLPYHQNQPAYLHILGMPESDWYVPLFSTKDQLEQVMAAAGREFDAIKLVYDGPDFLASIPYEQDGFRFHIILDPHFTEGGKVRWTEIHRQ